jgi:hypothetical protein
MEERVREGLPFGAGKWFPLGWPRSLPERRSTADTLLIHIKVVRGSSTIVGEPERDLLQFPASRWARSVGLERRFDAHAHLPFGEDGYDFPVDIARRVPHQR